MDDTRGSKKFSESDPEGKLDMLSVPASSESELSEQKDHLSGFRIGFRFGGSSSEVV